MLGDSGRSLSLLPLRQGPIEWDRVSGYPLPYQWMASNQDWDIAVSATKEASPWRAVHPAIGTLRRAACLLDPAVFFVGGAILGPSSSSVPVGLFFRVGDDDAVERARQTVRRMVGAEIAALLNCRWAGRLRSEPWKSADEAAQFLAGIEFVGIEGLKLMGIESAPPLIMRLVGSRENLFHVPFSEFLTYRAHGLIRKLERTGFIEVPIDLREP